jgi:EAL domain-containing protein (putative c-di-GMP-specific phosphodiesterase class I)
VIDIKRGINAGEFVLHYQPIVELSSMAIAGYEALMRWDHPDGMRYPDSFISQAEKEPDTIFSIFKFAISQASTDWEKLGDEKFIAINLSATSLAHPDLIQVLEDYKHTRLTLEITERVAIDMCDQHHFETLKTISKMDWVMLALDDFGLASIVQMLQVLEIFDDPQKLKVKLDMYFMQNLSKPRMRQTIKIIVQTIHEYGIKIVCEGVETDEQLEFLRAIACDYAQGFHPKLGKPMAIS